MKKINDCSVYEFTKLEEAYVFAVKCTKAMQILRGDDSYYLVATLADGEKLILAGYERVQEVVFEGEDGFELDDADEAALDRAWAKERTPAFLARMARQAAEYEQSLAANRKKA